MAPDLVAPAYLSIPDGYDPNRTLGPEVAAVATLAGFPPDPEQQLLHDVSFALDKRGRPLVFETVVIAPRQNIKTGFGKQRALGKLFVQDRELVVWSAHEFDTARRALLDLESLIDGSDKLRRRVALTSRGKVATHGAVPEITLQSGATLVFKTRTAGGGRGLTGDDLFVDEAFAAQAVQMGAIMPIMLARPNSQVDFYSSACRPESGYLWDLVQQGRAGGGPRMFYAEWAAPPPEKVCDSGEQCDHARGRSGCGCDKPEVIILAHSAVTRGRIELAKVVDLRRTIPPAEFGREIMGWHDEVLEDDDEDRLDVDAWVALTDAESAAETVGAFAVESDLSRAWASVSAVGGREDGLIHVELLEHRRGTSWLARRCVELDKEHGPCAWVIDGKGPVRDFIPKLEEAGLYVVTADTEDVAQAYTVFVDGLEVGSFRHGPQEDLLTAMGSARRRPCGEGGFTFGRRASGADISPVQSVGLALWALSELGVGGQPSAWVI